MPALRAFAPETRVPDQRFAVYRAEHRDHQADARKAREQAAGDAESGQQFDDADEEHDRLRQAEVFRAALGIARVREAAPGEDEAGECPKSEESDL